MRASRFALRVYYEDTDAGGIVYYANYLKFIERARTEALLALGVSQPRLQAETGRVFAVREVQAIYDAPARLEDRLEVVTEVTQVSGARIVMTQVIRRDEERIFTATVTLVCLGPGLRPARIPPDIAALLQKLAAGPCEAEVNPASGASSSASLAAADASPRDFSVLSGAVDRADARRSPHNWV